MISHYRGPRDYGGNQVVRPGGDGRDWGPLAGPFDIKDGPKDFEVEHFQFSDSPTSGSAKDTESVVSWIIGAAPKRIDPPFDRTR
jgi:hypothetical protein